MRLGFRLENRSRSGPYTSSPPWNTRLNVVLSPHGRQKHTCRFCKYPAYSQFTKENKSDSDTQYQWRRKAYTPETDIGLELRKDGEWIFEKH